jgi:hypothetical protein
MFDISNLYAFCIAVFIALTFTFAGVYLTDELSPANQLHQLSEGHQLTYFEDKYGFYSDGTVDRIIVGGKYVMTYALLSPVLSLPMLIALNSAPNIAGIVPLIFWIFCLMITMISIGINKKYIFAIGTFAIFINILLYKSFDTLNMEILAIVLTNTIIYGLFAVVVWRTISLVIDDDNAQPFAWLAVISCSSLLFWVGALKDHVIVALLFMIIVYMLIRLNESSAAKYLIYMSIATGLLLWERPELSIAVIPFITIYCIYIYRRNFIYPLSTFGIVTAISLIPSAINNYVVTGSPIKFPFQAVNQTLGGAHFLESKTAFDVLFYEFPAYMMANFAMITPENIIGILIFPLNGGVGIIPILLLPIFIILLIPYFIKYKSDFKLNNEEKILLFYSFAVIAMYLFTSYLGFRLHTESGILPDMRYFTIVYAPLVIVAMSIISRVYKFNYRVMFKRYVISVMSVFVVFLTLLMFIFNHGGVIYTSDINIIANFICIFLIGMLLASLVNMIRDKNYDGLSYLIPMMLALPLVWQILSSVIIQKIYAYPMFVPVVQLLKSFIFG